MKSFALTTALVATVSATARSSPPDGAVTVCKSGNCDYTTVSAKVLQTIPWDAWYFFSKYSIS